MVLVLMVLEGGKREPLPRLRPGPARLPRPPSSSVHHGQAGSPPLPGFARHSLVLGCQEFPSHTLFRPHCRHATFLGK